jgi:hypothetical protein
VGHCCLPFGEARRWGSIRRVRDNKNKDFYENRERRERVKREQNNGEDGLPVTGARRYSKKSGVRKGEILLNRCEERDVERKGDKGEERRGEVEGIRSKVK